MSSDMTVQMLLDRIVYLATSRQEPFIIIENPKIAEARLKNDGSIGGIGEGHLIATIGNAKSKFYGYTVYDLLEVYGDLKSQLAAEDAVKKAMSEREIACGAV